MRTNSLHLEGDPNANGIEILDDGGQPYLYALQSDAGISIQWHADFGDVAWSDQEIVSGYSKWIDTGSRNPEVADTISVSYVRKRADQLDELVSYDFHPTDTSDHERVFAVHLAGYSIDFASYSFNFDRRDASWRRGRPISIKLSVQRLSNTEVILLPFRMYNWPVLPAAALVSTSEEVTTRLVQWISTRHLLMGPDAKEWSSVSDALLNWTALHRPDARARAIPRPAGGYC